jgi:hypothetical protein
MTAPHIGGAVPVFYASAAHLFDKAEDYSLDTDAIVTWLKASVAHVQAYLYASEMRCEKMKCPYRMKRTRPCLNRNTARSDPE